MIANHKGEIPIVLLLLPFMLGIGVGIGPLSGAMVSWLTAVLLFLSSLFIILNLNYNLFKLYKYRWLGGTLVLPVLFLAGCISAIKYNELYQPNHFSKTPSQFLIASISNEPVLKNGLVRFTASVEQNVDHKNKVTVSGNILITIKDSTEKKLTYGDVLLIPSNYKAVDPPFNPAEFNYKNYLAHQNIHYQVLLFPKQHVTLETNAGNPLIYWSLKMRRHLVEKLKLHIKDTTASAIASTMILGYKADLSNNDREVYTKAGAIHILSVSGAQVGFIYFILSTMLGFLTRYKYGNFFRAIIIIALIAYYALLTGLSPAVCRASVMISIIIIGRTYNRYINSLNILAISAFVLLLYDPYLIADVGFQLSYVAISGLIIFRPLVYKFIKLKNKWADKLWGFCSMSISAQVITFPLSAFYFHQFPVYFLISNLLVIIPVAVILYSGILYLLLLQIPFVSASLAYILQKTILFMNKALFGIEQAPYPSISKIWITIPEYLLLYVSIISLFYFLYNKKVWLLRLCLASILLLSISWSLKKISLSRSGNIAWLNLNKHVGIVFKHNDQAVVISDLKETDKTYQYSVQPYLDSCQVNNTTLINLNQNISMPWFVKNNNLIQFLNSRIFLLNGKMQNNLFSQKLKTNYLYITNNPNNQPDNISESFDYQTMVIDGSNPDNLINRLKQTEENKHSDYKILKRNKFMISLSN